MSRLVLLAPVLVVALTGCTLAMPYQGTHIDPDTGHLFADATESGRVIVALTNAVVAPEHRDAFMEQTDAVVADLADRDGMLDYTLRAELFGKEVWTQTLWASEEAMLEFVVGDVHGSGMTRALDEGWFESARFAHVEVAAVDAPLAWEDVEEELGRASITY